MEDFYYKIFNQWNPIGRSPIWEEKNLIYSRPNEFNSIETIFGFKMDGEIWSILTNGYYYQEISETFLFLKLLPHLDYFIDVGANTGFYTLLAANNSNSNIEIISIEPHPKVFKKIKKSIKNLNKKCNINLIQKGISDKSGEGLLQQHRYGTGGSHLIEKKGNQDKLNNQYEIALTTIDSIISNTNTNLNGSGLMKIDTEGFEYEVLCGSRKFLNSKNKPLIMIEVLPDRMLKFLKSLKFLEEAGYSIYPIKRFPRQNQIVLESKLDTFHKRLNLYNVIALNKNHMKYLKELQYPFDLRLFNYPKDLLRIENFLKNSSLWLKNH